ncbi:RNA polymerase sigma factor [Anaerocolumna sp.]|uniref:RNA polymerase sigma factor n=1 Tax=Anaerocolumna sp. TaxID=2041569 RepID=UPI0028A97216|nr:RNA polymerase sigma factor [Anaerocolumna sp.]
MLEQDVGSLYECYYNDLYRYVYIMCLNSFDTEDILQNVFLKVIKGRKSFRGESSIKTWLFAIAHNECLNYLEKDKRKILVENADNIIITLGYGTDEILLQKETVKIILNFIQVQEKPIRRLTYEK